MFSMFFLWVVDSTWMQDLILCQREMKGGEDSAFRRLNPFENSMFSMMSAETFSVRAFSGVVV